LKVFASEWEFNSFGFAVLQRVLMPENARLFSIFLFAGVYVWLWSRKRDLTYAALMLGVFFLLSPVVNPWYLILLVPFVALRPSVWGVTALAAVLLSYCTGMNMGRADMGAFNHAWWVRPLEMLPILLAVLYDWSGRRRSGTSADTSGALATASV
jgi:hypothetical protein